MITIKFSTVKDPATDPPQVQSQEINAPDDQPKQRVPLAWIPVTLGVGLLIAALYLKGRIWVPHPHTPPNPPRVIMPPFAKPVPPPDAPKPAQPESEPIAAPSAPETATDAPAVEHPFVGPTLQEVEASEQGISLITPHPGERYIQVGAFNEQATRRFVEHLKHESRQPHVAAGPTPQILRVLIGPFDDPDKLAEEKKRLESEGVDTFVRKY